MDPVDAAVELYHRTPNATITGIAKEAGITRTRLSNRLNGKHQSRHDSANRKLSDAQELVLIDRMNRYSLFGILLSPREIRDLANLLSGEVTGINWASNFVERHKKDLKGGYFESQERPRYLADTPETREAFYTLVKSAYDLYKYRPCDIYNMDETGFSFSHDRKTYQVAPRGFRRNGKLKHEAGEHITVIAGIGVNSAPIRPVILYKGIRMNDKWVPDNWDDDILCDVTESGWANSFQVKHWLLDCFEPDTRARAEGNPRLVFWDGCESHTKVATIEGAWRHNIHLIQLPAHMSQRYQPLDCHFFGELKRQYHLQHSAFEMGAPGLRLAKPMFYGWFKKAWHLTVATKVIRAGWRDTGLWPLSREVMCPEPLNPERISTPERQIINSGVPKTPRSVHTIRINARHRRQSGKADDYATKAEALIESLLAQVIALKNEVEVLQKALDLLEESTSRKRKTSSKKDGEYYIPSVATRSREAVKIWSDRKKEEAANCAKKRAESKSKKVSETASTVTEPAQ